MSTLAVVHDAVVAVPQRELVRMFVGTLLYGLAWGVAGWALGYVGRG